jgi:hypothetical protein
MTQLGQRKLAQSKHRATALISLLLQQVQCTELAFSRELASRMLLTGKSGRRPLRPAAVGRKVSAWQVGQAMRSGCSCSFSRQGWQKEWKQESTLGMVYVSWQSGHLVEGQTASNSPSEELDAELVTVSVDGVGDDMLEEPDE